MLCECLSIANIESNNEQNVYKICLYLEKKLGDYYISLTAEAKFSFS